MGSIDFLSLQVNEILRQAYEKGYVDGMKGRKTPIYEHGIKATDAIDVLIPYVSRMTYKVLRRTGCTTIEDITDLTTSMLLHCKGVGEVKYALITSDLKRVGITIRGEL